MSASKALFDRAKKVIPGGVNSPVRAYGAVGGEPPFIASANGATITDVDGKKYIDYVGSWGPMILGHAHPAVIDAAQKALPHGLSYGAPCAAEVEMAELICDLLPSIDKVRMLSSGTEATMTALRVARGFTGREYIIKFDGCYHGHADSLLVKAGSGALTFGAPSSPGIPGDTAAKTLVANYNDLESVTALFEQYPDVAAIIVEPVAGNMNLVPPVPGFLEGLRALCNAHDALLIFDEVITGFRLGLQGAQGYYGVTPDLTTLGKIIGGGMPVGALGGRADVMDVLAPEGAVYQAGTLSGNPIAMQTGLATLKQLQAPGFYEALSDHTDTLVSAMEEAFSEKGIATHIAHLPGMFGLFFTDQTVITDMQAVQRCDQTIFQAYFQHMLASGIYLAPSAFEIGFVSAAHTADTLSRTLRAIETFKLNACANARKPLG